MNKEIEKYEKLIEVGKSASSLSAEDELKYRSTISVLENIIDFIKEKAPQDNTEAFKLIKDCFDEQRTSLKKTADAAGKKLSNVFKFCEEVFGEGQEMLILVTELTISYYGAHFISRYGCKEYFNHNKELLFYERQKEIITELENLDLDD